MSSQDILQGSFARLVGYELADWRDPYYLSPEARWPSAVHARIARWAEADAGLGRGVAPRDPALPGTRGMDARMNEPLAPKTTLGVGGCADLWVNVATEAELQELLRGCAQAGCAFRLLGAGSNVVVSDLGLRGVTARLTGDAFRAVSRGKAPPRDRQTAPTGWRYGETCASL